MEKLEFKCWQEIAPLIDECIMEDSEDFDEYHDEIGNYIKGIKGIDEFELIQEDQYGIDLEKSYIEYEVIIQRKSDSKYFKGTYYHAPHWWDDSEKFELIYYEVYITGKNETLIFE